MAIAKLILNSVTQMDVTGTTAVVSDVASGKKYIKVDGTEGIGTASFGPAVTIESLSVASNGTYTASSGYAFSPVTVSVPEPSGTSNITSNGTYDVASYASAVVSVSGGGGGDNTLDKLIDRTITEITNNTVSSVGGYVFYNCSTLLSVSLANASAIGSYAFQNCHSLETVYMPKCQQIGSNGFGSCSSLTTVSFPELTSFSGSMAFTSCRRLTTIYAPELNGVSYATFQYCYSLSGVEFPKATFVGSNAFYSCSKLSSALFEKAETIGSNAFYNCPVLANISFPECVTIYSGAFYSCKSLRTASFPKLISLGSNAFNRCFVLLSLYLMGSSVVSLVSTSAFNSTPIGGYTTHTGGAYGNVYVPASLYNTYLIASNWSMLSSRFVSV